jgi:hypothetical protein
VTTTSFTVPASSFQLFGPSTATIVCSDLHVDTCLILSQRVYSVKPPVLDLAIFFASVAYIVLVYYGVLVCGCSVL